MDLNATLIGQFIAMTVFVLFCMKFVWPPLIAAIEARQQKIADGLAAGEKAQDDLQKAEADAQVIINEARAQAASIVDLANQRANRMVEEAKENAVKERARQVEAASVEIEQSALQAKNELKQKVAYLAVSGAEKILDREVDQAAHQQLLDQLVSNM